jgi:hypothetical protein
MKKLVINTQYVENSGDLENPRWKYKDGETYIVNNITPSQEENINRHGIPNLNNLIEYRNDISAVFVIGYRVVDDNVVVNEDWEHPYILSFENNTWVCRRYESNDGSFRSPIVSKISKYIMGPKGERNNYQCSYEIEDGRVIPYNEITAIIRAYNKA